MLRKIRWSVVLLAAVAVPAARGNPPPGKALDGNTALGLLGNGSLNALVGGLRGYLVRSLPNPLYEDQRHWGQQKSVTRGIKWRGRLHVHPEAQKSLKNHGHWWKVRVTAGNLADTLVFDLRDAVRAEPGRLTFTAFVSFDTRVDFDRQNWRAGVRLYSGSVRARLRLKLTLRCEVTARLEGNGGLLPDAVFRFRVLQSDLRFDNFVVEHIAGVGGEAAKVLGDAARGSLNQWRPSLERDLLARANAAIVGAGAAREVRLSLLQLFSQKAAAPTPPLPALPGAKK